MDVHVYHHQDDRINEVLRLLRSLKRQGEAVMADLSALATEVAENGDAVASASALLTELSGLLRDAATDPAAIQALADQLDANNTALSEAVVANTPAAPPAP